MLQAGSFYARIRFEEEVEVFLTALAEQLQSNADGVFFATRSPYHIQLISATELQGISVQKTLEILKDLGNKYDKIQGNILPVCTVNRSGQVSLKISCSDFLVVAQHVAGLFPGANDWSVKQDDYLIVSIGTFQGPHISAFENWLNGELSTNSGVFPLFTCDIIEIAGEGGSTIGEQIKLCEKPRQRRSVVLLEETNGENDRRKSTTNNDSPRAVTSGDTTSIDNAAGSGTAGTGDDKANVNGDVPSKAIERVPDSQRLVTAVDPICKKIGGGSGMITPSFMSYAVLPTEPARWQEQCQKLYEILNQLLRSIGAKRFLAVLDLTCNPFGGNLIQSVLLGDKSSVFLDIKLLPDLRIETYMAVNSHTSIYEGLAVPIDVLPVPPTEGMYPGTHTAVMCIPMAAGPLLQADRGGGGAVLALHINAEALLSLGMRPPEGHFHFSMPFARLDATVNHHHHPGGRGGMYSNSGRGMRLGRGPRGPPQPMYANMPPQHMYGPYGHPTVHMQQPHRAQPMPVNGDWICPTCKALVFAFRNDCFRCHTVRPEKAGAAVMVMPRQPPRTDVHPEGDVRDGDWLCDSCGGHNFATKIACFTCRCPRPPGYALPAATEGEEAENREGKMGTTVLPGDWTCPNCKENVFAKRNRCYKCSTSRPAPGPR